jgi:hypothetical protein
VDITDRINQELIKQAELGKVPQQITISLEDYRVVSDRTTKIPSSAVVPYITQVYTGIPLFSTEHLKQGEYVIEYKGGTNV